MPSPDTYSLSLHDALPITAPFTRSSTRFPPGVAVFSTVPRALASFGPVRLDRIVRVSASGPTIDPTEGMDEATRDRASATTTKDRKSTRLNSSHVKISYAVPRHLLSFPTRRSSDHRSIHEELDEVPARSRRVFDGSEGARFVRSGSLGQDCEGERVRANDRSDGRHGRGNEGQSQRNDNERSEEHTSELQSRENLVCRPPTPTLFPYTTLFRSPLHSRGARRGSRQESPCFRRFRGRSLRSVRFAWTGL